MKNILLIFACLCCYISGNSQQAATMENSMLWKIEGNGLTEASYLFGTIHLMCEDDFLIKDKVKKALESTENLTLEVNFADPKEMAWMQENMFSDEKLSEQLSEEQSKKLDQYLKKHLNVSLSTYDNFSLMTLYSLALTQSIECQSNKMWEMELIAIAKQSEKAIFGLETLQEQMEFFDHGYSDEELLEQIFIMDEYTDVFEQMVEYYKAEDVENLYSVMDDDKYMDDETTYWLLEKRNKNWQSKIPKMLDNGSHFFAVGAAHLVGEYGMIQLLREQGYTVTAVSE